MAEMTTHGASCFVFLLLLRCHPYCAAAGDVSDSRFSVRHRLKCCAKLVRVVTVHLTELPHLRKRGEIKDKGKQRQRKENVYGRRRSSEGG
jgi:hypothetical protein